VRQVTQVPHRGQQVEEAGGVDQSGEYPQGVSYSENGGRGRGRLLFVSSVAGRQGGVRARQMMTPEEVAAGIADAAQAPQLPLRIPLGRTAREVLAARRAAPDNRPFILGESTPVPAADAR
jgi:hypothetical protein